MPTKMLFNKVSLEQFSEAVMKETEGLSVDDIKALYDDIKTPKRATKKSAGNDFYAPYSFILEPNQTIKIPTGMRWVCFSDNYVLQIYPRSSLGFKYRLGLANTVGIVDADYHLSDNEGHIFIKLANNGDKPVEIKKGEAFAQGIITKFYTVDDDSVDEVRNGGFGSTNGSTNA